MASLTDKGGGARAETVYLAGRYIKLQRGISQSPWVIKGDGKSKRKSATSVEEEIARCIIPHFSPEDYKFSSSGREDIDVRMLGEGRPFVLEIIGPKCAPPSEAVMSRLERMTNEASEESVIVRNLRIVPKSYCAELHAGAKDKQKTYACVVWSKRAIVLSDLRGLEEKAKDLEIAQQTPVRVLHNRSQLVRSKMVHTCFCEYLNPHYFIMRVLTSAGTYVKEFVHGDLGRTSPSVAEILGTEAVIMQLDVEDLIM